MTGGNLVHWVSVTGICDSGSCGGEGVTDSGAVSVTVSWRVAAKAWRTDGPPRRLRREAALRTRAQAGHFEEPGQPGWAQMDLRGRGIR